MLGRKRRRKNRRKKGCMCVVSGGQDKGFGPQAIDGDTSKVFLHRGTLWSTMGNGAPTVCKMGKHGEKMEVKSSSSWKCRDERWQRSKQVQMLMKSSIKRSESNWSQERRYRLVQGSEEIRRRMKVFSLPNGEDRSSLTARENNEREEMEIQGADESAVAGTQSSMCAVCDFPQQCFAG